jgi:diguanylate cyclase (GGDEF)-like protein/PAS domain S-box-containing protein
MINDELITPEILSNMLLRMFEFAPVAMSITTSDAHNSRYVKVNDAYLKLTGLKWDDIRDKELTSAGSAIDSPARNERRRLIDVEGGYKLQEVELRHVEGHIIPTLISAQRTEVGNQHYDIEIIIDVTAKVELQRELDTALRTAVRTDALSGLPNRLALDEHLARVLHHRELATVLAFIDLNGFKSVNDTLGHAVGDKMLEMVGHRLKNHCRATDFVARLGGDEFVVVLQMPPEKLDTGLDNFAANMEEAFQAFELGGKTISIGAAIGIAASRAGTDSPDSLLERADQCMYAAKETGALLSISRDSEWTGKTRR